MYLNALIGIDELDGGPDAIALARNLTVDDASLSLVRAFANHAPVARGGTLSLHNAERGAAEVALRRACRASGVEGAWAIGGTSVAAGFQELAAHVRADLIVLGSGAYGLSRRTSVPQALVETLPLVTCPVAVAPVGYEYLARPLRRVGVAFEETIEGHQALKLARQTGAVHAADVTVLENFSDGLQSRALAAESARRLRDFSESLDLLVIGARGGGPLRRLTHASATPSLVRGVSCPVLMVTAETKMPFVAPPLASEQWTTKVLATVRPL